MINTTYMWYSIFRKIGTMPISGKNLIREFEKAGWVIDRQKGSHVTLKKGQKVATIPVHGNRDLGKGLEKKLRKILEG